MRGGGSSSESSSACVEAATWATAASKAAWLRIDGLRMPATLRTYCNAAASTSSAVTVSAYGGRRVLMLLHTRRRYRRPGPDHRRAPRRSSVMSRAMTDLTWLDATAQAEL